MSRVICDGKVRRSAPGVHRSAIAKGAMKVSWLLMAAGAVVWGWHMHPVAADAPAAAHETAGMARGRFEPPVAKDINPDPHIVEVNLEARVTRHQFVPGPPTTVFTYNGSLPGPAIEANVGDMLIVNFINHLPQETTIHWHGVEVPANMDGSNISQRAIPPGGTFRYAFELLSPATHWYHPHLFVNEQIEMGLAGMLVVRDPAGDTALGLPRNERMVVLDDVLLDESGAIAPPLPEEPLARAKMLLDGREGNVLLVNGQAGRVLDVRIGEPQRWWIVNVANARFMRLSIPGHRIWRIGGDGGLLEHPLEIPPIPSIPDPQDPDREISDPDPDKGLLLSVAERADIVFTPMGQPGELIPVEWHDFPRGRHDVFRRDDGTIGFGRAADDGTLPPQPLMHLRLLPPKAREPVDELIPPQNLRDIPEIDPTGAEPLQVTFGHTAPDADGNVTFFAATETVNGMITGLPFPAVTPSDAQDVEVGERRIWEITNLTASDHPFHPHGWFMQPMEIQLIDLDTPANNRVVPFPHLENKDTMRIPKRPGAAGRSRTIVRAAVLFDDDGREGLVAASGKEPTADTSGGWVFHCHNEEHAEHGMMSFFEVFYPPSQ